MSNDPIRGGRPRRLTPQECARLMGFYKAGERPFEVPVSDTQAYKQFGNSVVVPVFEAIAKMILPFVEEIKSADEKRRVA
jgi:DNA (cytosine-5)-methyltransferase 1